jgi:hypothetical protein
MQRGFATPAPRLRTWFAAVVYSSTDGAEPALRTTRMLAQFGACGIATGDGVAVCVCDVVDVEEAVCEDVDVIVVVPELDAVCELDAVDDAEEVAVDVAVQELDAVAPCVRLDDGEPVCVGETDGVWLEDGVCDGVTVDVGVGSAGTGITPMNMLPAGAVASSVKPAPTTGDASCAVS